MMAPQDVGTFQGWMPILLNEQGTSLLWMERRAIRFVEPFFDQTVMAAMRATPPPATRLSSPALLEEFADQGNSPPLAGLIMQVSRCGSTLLANLLAASPRNLVLSEPGPFEVCLRATLLSASLPATWLTGLVNAMTSCRIAPETRCFLKCTSWHLLMHTQIRTAFPSVPLVILYRDPVEVLVSNLRQPSGWFAFQQQKGIETLIPTLCDCHPAALLTMPKAEFGARLLGAFYQQAVQAAGPHTLLVNYTQLSQGALAQILTFCHTAAVDAELAEMMRAGQFYSKDPTRQQPFDPQDSWRKQQTANPEVRRLAERWCGDAYQTLEGLRLRTSAAA